MFCTILSSIALNRLTQMNRDWRQQQLLAWSHDHLAAPLRGGVAGSGGARRNLRRRRCQHQYMAGPGDQGQRDAVDARKRRIHATFHLLNAGDRQTRWVDAIHTAGGQANRRWRRPRWRPCTEVPSHRLAGTWVAKGHTRAHRCAC